MFKRQNFLFQIRLCYYKEHKFVVTPAVIVTLFNISSLLGNMRRTLHNVEVSYGAAMVPFRFRTRYFTSAL